MVFEYTHKLCNAFDRIYTYRNPISPQKGGLPRRRAQRAAQQHTLTTKTHSSIGLTETKIYQCITFLRLPKFFMIIVYIIFAVPLVVVEEFLMAFETYVGVQKIAKITREGSSWRQRAWRAL